MIFFLTKESSKEMITIDEQENDTLRNKADSIKKSLIDYLMFNRYF
jgi:hypothetical protein